MIDLQNKTQEDISEEVADRMRARRRELGLTQSQLAARSGVSLGSLKRFERLHEVSLTSLVKLALALGCPDDFDALFARRAYRSIDEVLADARVNFR